jgi:hypothetical protein
VISFVARIVAGHLQIGFEAGRLRLIPSTNMRITIDIGLGFAGDWDSVVR